MRAKFVVIVITATLVGCSSAPTDHLGGVTPADLVQVGLAAGLNCSADVPVEGDVHTTVCSGGDLDGYLSFGGSTTDTVSHIEGGAPILSQGEETVALADAVAELDYAGGDPDAFKEWIRTQESGITNDLFRDFGPARTSYVLGGTFSVRSLDTVGAPVNP